MIFAAPCVIHRARVIPIPDVPHPDTLASDEMHPYLRCATRAKVRKEKKEKKKGKQKKKEKKIPKRELMTYSRQRLRLSSFAPSSPHRDSLDFRGFSEAATDGEIFHDPRNILEYSNVRKKRTTAFSSAPAQRSRYRDDN